MKVWYGCDFSERFCSADLAEKLLGFSVYVPLHTTTGVSYKVLRVALTVSEFSFYNQVLVLGGRM